MSFIPNNKHVTNFIYVLYSPSPAGEGRGEVVISIPFFANPKLVTYFIPALCSPSPAGEGRGEVN